MGLRRIIHPNNLVRTLAVGVLLAMTSVVGTGVTCAMGDEMKLHRDSGVIGEKKTVRGEKHSYDASTGITYRVHGQGTFATPQVIGDVAYFGSARYPTTLGYGFRFNCLGWRYQIREYWFNADGTPNPEATADRVGFWIRLESPDKTSTVETKIISIDMPLAEPLATLPTSEQVELMQRQGEVGNSLIREKQLAIAQQSVMWLVTRSWQEYHLLTDTPLHFTIERIGEKTFIKTEFEVLTQESQVPKKCVMWALNLWGYRLGKDTWVCYVIGEAPDYESLAAKVHMILETLQIDPAPDPDELRKRDAELERNLREKGLPPIHWDNPQNSGDNN